MSLHPTLPVPEDDGFVPRGAAHLDVPDKGAARDFFFFLLPHATMLGFTAAIEPLRVANQLAGRALYRWFTVTVDGAPSRCSNRLSITPDMALSRVPPRAFVFACGGVQPQDITDRRIIDGLRRHAVHGGGVGGICSGAFALARAGVLSGRTFTLHWENQPAFSETFPDLTPSSRLFEIDRGLMTCGGGHAATDMMLSVIEQDYGTDLALIVADMCLHRRGADEISHQRSPDSAALGSRSPQLIRAVAVMREQFEDVLTMEQVAERAGISKRQLERLFRQHTGQTPMRFYTELRLARAFALINETDLSVAEIAAATGFAAPHFARRFRARFGSSPHSYRKGWHERGPNRDTGQ
ncbi:GlxA family transcriptional regulator [Shimia biformata]|uniref:GlxA family transcriptional regulator n=1 Tax=Shimia biformata TaxID=1294299 RepID=UPI00194E8582|nr:GlxA family transcriptional regulator [Shimia biformata]